VKTNMGRIRADIDKLLRKLHTLNEPSRW
jgi:hypothetical protein